jgi:HKD family nuclease
MEKLLESRSPFFKEVWMVSAFANRQGLIRLLPCISKSIKAGAKFHFIIGVDQQGTSTEALKAVLSLNADAKLVKNRRVGHTFHPKIYLFEADNRATICLGSSNLTEGGIYRNYEANILISYDLNGPDGDIYRQHKNTLSPFLNPTGTKTIQLTEEVIQALESRGDIISELQKRELARKVRESSKPTASLPKSPFGGEEVPPPPPLPEQFVRTILENSQKRRPRKASSLETQLVQCNAFYMHLTRLQGKTIPGEPRIPIAARDIAEKFWGWPDKYSVETRTTGKHPRNYKTWKPKWRIVDTADPSTVHVEDVRMYEYEDSEDFRFYSSRLVSMGADELDIVRITRISPAEEAVFQCELAKRGSPLYPEWDSYCTIPIRNSKRRFGFA